MGDADGVIGLCRVGRPEKVDRGFDWAMLHTVKGMGYRLRSRPD